MIHKWKILLEIHAFNHWHGKLQDGSVSSNFASELRCTLLKTQIITTAVHDQKKLVHECQFACAALSAQAIVPEYLELHMQSKIFIYEMQSFLLLKNFKCLS